MEVQTRKRWQPLALLVILLFSITALAQNHHLNFTFEDDVVGQMPVGWRHSSSKVEDQPDPAVMKIEVTDRPEHQSYFDDIFPSGSKSLYALDNGTENKISHAISIIHDFQETSSDSDFFFSFDFKIIQTGNILVFINNGNADQAVRIRVQADKLDKSVEIRHGVLDAEGKHVREANGNTKGVYSYLGDNIVLNKWYRLQLRFTRESYLMEFTLLSEDGISYELNNVVSLNPLDNKGINRIMINSTAGGRTETGEWLIDNLYAKDFEFGSRSTIASDKSTLLADNESIANIELVIRNDFGNMTPSVPVILAVPEGREGAEVKGAANWGQVATATADSEGKVQFQVRGSKSGPLTLTATAQHPASWDQTLIQTMAKELELTLVPSVNENNSSIANEPKGAIKADGKTTVEIKVSLRGTDSQEVISGREVELVNLPGFVTVKDKTGKVTNKATTDENGEVTFALSSLGSWQGPVKVQVDRIVEGLEKLVLAGPTLTFEGLIASTSYTLTPEHDVYGGKVPADGSSNYLLEITLRDKSDSPLGGYWVEVEPIAGLNIQALAAQTDETGKIRFLISTQTAGDYNLAIRAEAGTYSIPVETITFETHTAEYPPVIIRTIPKDTNDHYEVTGPIEIYFNKAIDFEHSTNMNLKFSADGKEQVVRPGDEYGNWTYIEAERKIKWTPTMPLWANHEITAILQGAVDAAGFVMDAYSWSFIAIDETGPSLITDACFPRPGEIEVTLDAKLKLTFDEAIYSENNRPKGLQLKLTNVTRGESVSFGSADFSFVSGKTDQVELELSGYLVADAIYELEIKGAIDNALNLMEPEVVSWSFAAVDQTPPKVEAVYPLAFSVIPEGEFARKITLTFDENVDLTNATCTVEIRTDGTSSWEDGNLILSSDYNEATFTWTLYPTSSEWIYNKEYKVTVAGVRDKIDDPYGNPKTPNLMADYVWQFKPLLSISAPIPQEHPQKGALGVSVTEQIIISFDKAILFENAALVLKTKEESTVVAGQINFLEKLGTTATGITFKPEQPLNYDTWYQVDVSGIEGELAGSRLEDYSYSFRTEALGSAKTVLADADNTLEFSIGPVLGDSRRNVSIFVPGGSVAIDSQLTAFNLPNDKKRELNQHLYADGQRLSPEVYEFQLDGELAKSATVTIPYLDDGTGNVVMLDGSKVAANSLQIFAWNPVRQEWEVQGGIVDFDTKTVSCQVEEFRIFAVIGTSKEATALLSEVALSVNPLAFTAAHRQETTFNFRLGTPAKVSLVIYDDRGRVVATLLKDEPYSYGYNSFSWDGYVDGKRVQPGVYLYRLFVTSLDSEHKGDAWVGGTLGVIR